MRVALGEDSWRGWWTRLVSAEASPSRSKNSGRPPPSTCTIASSSALPMRERIPVRGEQHPQRPLRVRREGRQHLLDRRLAGVALDEREPGLEHRSLDLLHRRRDCEGSQEGSAAIYGSRRRTGFDPETVDAPADPARRGALHRSVRAHDGGGVLPRGDAGDRPPSASSPAGCRPTRAFIVAAGLEDALEYARGLHFTPDAIEYLRSLGRFEPEFLEYLASLRFTGEIRAVAEGTVIFPDEPMLEVTAPVIEAQLLESALLKLCHLQSVLASKAARVVIAAQGRDLAEFGMRRSHGTDAALKAARCAWITGFDSTSDVLAGRTYGIPLSGTMAHSFVTAFGDELEAFRAYARAFPTARSS